MIEPKFCISPADLAEVLNISVQGLHKILKTEGMELVKDGRSIYIRPTDVRKILTSRGYKYPNEILSFLIVKGGTGKSVLAFHTAIRLSHYGAKVLMIDLDQQGNLSSCFGDFSEANTFSHFLLPKESAQAGRVDNFQDLIVPISDMLDLIPSNMNNASAEHLFATQRKSMENFFRNALKPLQTKYDYIIFDCPPALSLVNLASAFASDKIVMPVNPDKFSVDALKQMFTEFKSLSEEYKHTFDYAIVLNKFDQRKNLSHEIYETLLQSKLYSQFLQKPFVSDNHVITKAALTKTTVFHAFKAAPISTDIDLIVRSMLNLSSGVEKKEVKTTPIVQSINQAEVQASI